MNSFIYIIRQTSTRLFKIGVSKNPAQRLKTLQTGNPNNLSLLYTVRCTDVSAFKAETVIHQHLTSHQIKGEWFLIPTDDQVVSIAKSLSNSLCKTTKNAKK